MAPAMSTQLPPLASQRCHWYANEVGESVQVPLPAVSVPPTAGDPETVGALEFCGAPSTPDGAEMASM